MGTKEVQWRRVAEPRKQERRDKAAAMMQVKRWRALSRLDWSIKDKTRTSLLAEMPAHGRC